MLRWRERQVEESQTSIATPADVPAAAVSLTRQEHDLGTECSLKALVSDNQSQRI